MAQQRTHSETHCVAVDGSSGSDSAFKYATSHTPSQDKLVLVSGSFVDSTMELVGVPQPSRLQAAEAAHKALRERYAKMCVEAKRECSFERIDYSTTSDLGYDINAIADKHKVASIIVGSRGLGGIQGALLGSVSTTILHRATRPVTVVRPEKPTGVLSKTVKD